MVGVELAGPPPDGRHHLPGVGVPPEGFSGEQSVETSTEIVKQQRQSEARDTGLFSYYRAKLSRVGYSRAQLSRKREKSGLVEWE